jgi:signal transduction histidine kinase
MTPAEEPTEFWTTIVFQLRQPMTAVSGQAQRAQRLLATDPERAGQAMDQVVAQIARLDRVLDQLLKHVDAREPMETR